MNPPLVTAEGDMTDPFGFLTTPPRPVAARPSEERLGDWNEVHAGQTLLPVVSLQAGRCMDCGIPCGEGRGAAHLREAATEPVTEVRFVLFDEAAYAQFEGALAAGG
ncbi:hypothetical protein [Streptomyces sp. NPDC018833]|uniref:hypothetical protein n=1 Tax=Streptomyces sp. NPDC018833 TaxID=3365053 RepID=UPI0037ADB13C